MSWGTQSTVAGAIRAFGWITIATGMSAVAAAQGGVEGFCRPGWGGITLTAEGSADLTANEGHGDLVLVAQGAPAPFGWFLMGDQRRKPVPFEVGALCVTGSRGRLIALAADPIPMNPVELSYGVDIVKPPGTYTVTHSLDYLDELTIAGLIEPGSTWNFQFFDRQGGVVTASNGLAITFATGLPLEGWKPIEQGILSDHPAAEQRNILIIDSAQEWAEFNSAHDGGAAGYGDSSVDFSSEQVLVVFAGNVPHAGVEIEIVELSLSVTTLDLQTITTSPGEGCLILPVVTQPYHIVRMPKVERLRIGQWTNVSRRNASCLED